MIFVRVRELLAEVRLWSGHVSEPPSGHQLPSLAGRRAARIKGEENYETGLLLFGLATGLMWLRTLSFVLVQQDLGQALLHNTCICERGNARERGNAHSV
jgi:hypothetical protein